MKKSLLLGLLVLTLASTQAFSLGIGASVGAPFGSAGVNPGAALSVKLDNKSPWVFGLGFAASSGNAHIGATADYWMAQGKLVDFLNYYAGPGLFLGLSTGSTSSLDLGVRIPVGINAFLLDRHLELFLELAPALGLDVNPLRFPTLALQNALGFRFWF